MSQIATSFPASGATSTALGRARLRDRVEGLLDYIRAGRILEAMEEFYAPDVAMRENANPPTVGLAENIERERQFLAQVREWRAFDVRAVGVDEARGVTLVENRVEFVATSGATVTIEQVSVARWRDGKIVEERFYYDTAAKTE